MHTKMIEKVGEPSVLQNRQYLKDKFLINKLLAPEMIRLLAASSFLELLICSKFDSLFEIN